jgi:hypothetical protein
VRVTAVNSAGQEFPAEMTLQAGDEPAPEIARLHGIARMLLDSTSLDDLARRQAAVLERTTLHLRGLVDDLLDLARLTAGHISIDPEPTPGGRMVRDVIENHLPSAAARHLTIVDRVQPDRAVHADGRRLRQAGHQRHRGGHQGHRSRPRRHQGDRGRARRHDQGRSRPGGRHQIHRRTAAQRTRRLAERSRRAFPLIVISATGGNRP